jgi:hypothetical protein
LVRFPGCPAGGGPSPGVYLNNFSDNLTVNVGFNNVEINGVYNRNIGAGQFRNQGSLAFINMEPDQEVTPVTFVGQMFSQGNKVTVGNYNYAVNVNFNDFRGSGIVVLDVMAGSFCNQLTCLTVNMGKSAIPQQPLASVLSVMQGNPTTTASLTNKQMQAVVATSDNDFNKVNGAQQNAAVSMQGSPNVQGMYAITLSAGVNNQVMHNVGINFDSK